ncbi:unnamed protein product, partial [Ectocarpus sp. 12 AP-2014]
ARVFVRSLSDPLCWSDWGGTLSFASPALPTLSATDAGRRDFPFLFFFGAWGFSNSFDRPASSATKVLSLDAGLRFTAAAAAAVVACLPSLWCSWSWSLGVTFLFLFLFFPPLSAAREAWFVVSPVIS